jgi:hypothetical protein
MLESNYYCLTKEKPLLRGILHFILLLSNPILFINFLYNYDYSMIVLISFEIKLFFSSLYHLTYIFYKYNIKQEIILQNFDHFGINLLLFTIFIPILYKLKLYLFISIYLFIMFVAYFYTNNYMFFGIYNGLIPFIVLPYELSKISYYLSFLSITALSFNIIGFTIYYLKSYKFYYKNIYIFGYHEIFHLFTCTSIYIGVYIALAL